jgi:hypothetical protein
MSQKPIWQPAKRTPLEQVFGEELRSARLKIGDRVTAQGFPSDYPLMILAIAGGKVAIGSPRWPIGANYGVFLCQIRTVNGSPVAFPECKAARKARPNRRKGRKPQAKKSA